MTDLVSKGLRAACLESRKMTVLGNKFLRLFRCINLGAELLCRQLIVRAQLSVTRGRNVPRLSLSLISGKEIGSKLLVAVVGLACV